MTTREGENKKVWFRSNRFFNVGNEYFFSTREGANVGPYNNKLTAERGLSTFIELRSQEHPIEHAAKAALGGNWSADLDW